MSKKVYIIQLVTCLILLAAIISLESFTSLDIWLQQFWFDQDTDKWLLTREAHQKYRWIFYGGAKKIISIFAGICVAALLVGLLREKQRRLIRPALLLVLSLAFVPLTASTGKKYTNIYCPDEITEFGGLFVYQRILECPRAENAGQKPGHCFPAAHASGGFALMALYFCLPRQRWLGLGIGLAAGWIMGNYQMLRGEHFLSHTLTTMLLAWLLILLLLPLSGKFTTWYLRKRNWPA